MAGRTLATLALAAALFLALAGGALADRLSVSAGSVSVSVGEQGVSVQAPDAAPASAPAGEPVTPDAARAPANVPVRVEAAPAPAQEAPVPRRSAPGAPRHGAHSVVAPERAACA